jgi:hypothetical protein
MVVVRRGRGREDADRRLESAGSFDGFQIGIAHPAAKFRTAFEKESSHGSGSEFVESNAGQMIAESLPDIRNKICREVLEIHPAQVVTFVRFGIEWLSLPLLDLDKKIHALLLFHAVHDRGKGHIARLDPDADLFLCFTSCGVHDSFTAIQMTGRDAVLPIGITGVETPR